ncbi:ABC transporter permease [[Clostridium] innocuum]|nr:ABC transporter permease [[Clostridium] innocuum]
MPLFTLLLVLAVWEGCVRIFAIDLYILPAPSKIVQALFTNREVLWMHSLVTLQEAVAGLLIATLLAVVIAIGMDVSQIFKHSIFPHLVVTQTVPVMVLGPLFSIWLGFGMAPKILMVIFMCFFPVVIAFCDALGKVDEHQISLLKSFSAKKWQIYAYVKIPAASTALFSGLKVAATYCIGGAIVGEWLSASAGLGYYMIRVKNGYMLDKVFACVVVIIALSLLLHGAVVLLEAVLFPYAGKKKGRKA